MMGGQDRARGRQDLVRIAVWGYGMYGRRVHRDLMSRGTCQVVDIYDRALCGRMDDSGTLPIRDPQDIAARFAMGAFDAVAIGAGDPNVGQTMRASLQEWGIPVAEQHEDRPTLFGAEHFDLVPDPGLTIDREGYRLSCLRGAYGAFSHKPQELLHVFDARGDVLGDNYLQGDERWEDSVGRPPAFSAAQLEGATRLEGEWCACSRLWARNYCHFTFQTLDQVALMEEAGFTGRYLLVRSPFAPELVRLMGIDATRVAWMDDFDAQAPVRFERLFVLAQDHRDFDTFSRNSAPALMGAVNRIEASLPTLAHGLPKRLFVKRVGTRKLLGADELLERYGFVTVVPEELTVEEQIQHFHAADVVVTPHGANSTNSIYMRPGTAFVETFDRDWGYPWSDDLLLRKGVHYLPVVQARNVPVSSHSSDGDYRVSSPTLEHALRNAIRLAQSMEEVSS